MTRNSVTVARPPSAASGHSAVRVKRGRLARGCAIVPVRRRKSLRTATGSGADHGVPKTVVSKFSSLPSAVPRATHVHAPGRGKTDSGTVGRAKVGLGHDGRAGDGAVGLDRGVQRAADVGLAARRSGRPDADEAGCREAEWRGS